MAVHPVKSFIDEAIEADSIENDYVAKSDMYEAYRLFCKKHSLAPKPIVVLGKEIKKMNIAEGREGRGERRTCWLGVRLKLEYRPIAYEQQSVTSYI